MICESESYFRVVVFIKKFAFKKREIRIFTNICETNRYLNKCIKEGYTISEIVRVTNYTYEDRRKQ